MYYLPTNAHGHRQMQQGKNNVFHDLYFLLLSPFRVRFWHLRLVTGCQGICEPNLLPLLNNRRSDCAIDRSKIYYGQALCKRYSQIYFYLFRLNYYNILIHRLIHSYLI